MCFQQEQISTVLLKQGGTDTESHLDSAEQEIKLVTVITELTKIVPLFELL